MERILAAAVEMLDERVDLGFTIVDLAARAGTSVGTVYRHFSTKEDIVLAIQERLQREEEETILASWAAQDWSGLDEHAIVTILVQSLARRWRQHGALLRVLMTRRLQKREDQIYENALSGQRRRRAMFAAVLLSRQASMVHPAPQESIDFMFRLIEGTCSRWTAGAIEARIEPELDWDAMVDRLADVVAVYLFG